MRRKPIHRGGIVSAGYDPVTRALDIEFDTKRVLRYENVGNEVAERFLCSAERQRLSLTLPSPLKKESPTSSENSSGNKLSTICAFERSFQ